MQNAGDAAAQGNNRPPGAENYCGHGHCRWGNQDHQGDDHAVQTEESEGKRKVTRMRQDAIGTMDDLVHEMLS